MTTPADEAWAAGLFEGEGHVSLKTGKAGSSKIYPQMVLQITDLDVLTHFQQVVGVGKIHLTAPDTRGVRARKPLYRWSCTRLDATQDLFEMFKPYLGSRRTEQFTGVLAARKFSRESRKPT